MPGLVRNCVIFVVALASFMSASVAIFGESPRDEPPRYCTVFHHHVKSGGTAVKLQLMPACKRTKSRLPESFTGLAGTTAQMRLNTVHNASIIVGFAERLRAPLMASGRDCEFFTMMRHPIERLISMFYYCPKDHDIQLRPPKFCADAVGQTESVKDRLMEFARKHWGNRAYRSMLDAVFCNPMFELCDREHARASSLRPNNIDTEEGWQLQDVVKRVLSTYTAVGIVEEYELSMRLFDAKVTSPVRSWDPAYEANRANNSAEREELLSWAYTNVELHSVISADMLLYDFAVAIFRQQTKDAQLL